MAYVYALPKFVTLKSSSNNKYLGKDGDYLVFSQTKPTTTYAKFQVETSESNDALVHIKCCHNNKFLVRNSSSDYYIVAAASQKENDQSKWSCTLFKPIIDGNTKTVRFFHVQSGRYASAQSTYSYRLRASLTYITSNDLFSIIDWESILILPQYVAFKGNNDRYLRLTTIDKLPYLQFSGTDKGESTARHEIVENGDGSIRIKCVSNNKYWRHLGDWVRADTSNASSTNVETSFWPVKISNNVIALRSLNNNSFCKRLTTDGKTSCLNASVSTITEVARLEVEELVFSREVYDVVFRLDEARIYDESPVAMVYGGVTNTSSTDVTQEVRLTASYTTTKTWETSLSMKLGVEMKITSGVPDVSETSVTVTTTFDKSYSWGEIVEETVEQTDRTTVTAEPQSKMTVYLLSTKGSCDVPFSYTVREYRTDGTTVTYTRDDGMFTGISYYNFKTETYSETL